MNGVRVLLQLSIAVRSVMQRSERMMSLLLWHGCWSWSESIPGLVIAESPNCFSVKGIEWAFDRAYRLWRREGLKVRSEAKEKTPFG